MSPIILEDTQVIYENLQRVMENILGPDEIRMLSQIPGIMSRNNQGTPQYNQDEMQYIMAYAALAKSAFETDPDEYKIFRYWARQTIQKATKKISRNRRLELLHALCGFPAFEHRKLHYLLIALIEDDDSR